MKVIAIRLSSFAIAQYDNVSNIAYASGSVTITAGGNTYNYNLDDYKIQILW